MSKLSAPFHEAETGQLDAHMEDPQVIVDAIYDLATGSSRRFRTIIARWATSSSLSGNRCR